MKIINRIFILILPLMVLWFFIIAIRYNGNMSNVFIDLKASLNRLTYNSGSNFVNTFNSIRNDFQNVINGSWTDMLGSFDFGNVNDLVSFFVAIGNFFKGIGLFLYSLVLFIVYGVVSVFRVALSLLNMVLLIFDFIINPISFVR